MKEFFSNKRKVRGFKEFLMILPVNAKKECAILLFL